MWGPALLVVPQLLQDLLGCGCGVGYRGHRLIGQGELLPSAGEVPVHRRGRLLKPPDEICPVSDHQRPHLSHAHVEVLQRLQQGGVVRPVPEDAGLVLI